MPKKFRDPALDIRAKKSHPLDWLLEPLEEHPGYLRRRMFGGEAVYINGRLCLSLIAGKEPWNGILVVTGREFHEPLIAQWKALRSHEVLGKWLYLSQSHAAFESVAPAIVRAIYREDPRIGIEPKPRKKRLTAKGAKKIE
ncbi:MAG TPA: hypothetical protein VG733_19480 [Chthoniobacteraceae bacterium]|nr:hypothetical protein [Chthoniobacteraceae bacterium]